MEKERQSFSKSVSQQALILAASLALAAGTVFLYGFARFQSSAESREPQPSESAPAIIAIAALGRLEPEGEVIRLSASSSLEGARIKQLLVKDGNKVKAGQVIAILDSYDPRLAALDQAEQQVKVAHSRLEKVKAGAQVGEIAAQKAAIARLEAELRGQIAAQKANLDRLEAQLEGEKKAQQATVARLEAELENAKSEFERYEQLYRAGAIEASKFDSKRLILSTSVERLNEAKATRSRTVETLEEQIEEAEATRKRTVESLQEQIGQAKATLEAKAEVRPVDVRAAEAEIDSALAAVKRAKADLDLASVRSPTDGKILKIKTRPGEIASSEGIAEIGQTDRMYARAEIYETDIGKVRLGQRATITSIAFEGKLQGTVTEIGSQVDRQGIFDVSPGADTDRKVVEVKIRLDEADSQRVAGLTNLQVEVTIPLQPPSAPSESNTSFLTNSHVENQER